MIQYEYIYEVKTQYPFFVMIRTTCVPSPSGGGTGWGCNCELKKSDFLGITPEHDMIKNNTKWPKR